MADTKTTGLDELTVAAAADLLYIIDDVAGTPTGKKITVANLAANLGAIAGTRITLTGGTQTDSAPIVNGSVAWNDAAEAFTAVKINVTDTASAAASLLLDLQIGAASKLSVDKSGQITALTFISNGSGGFEKAGYFYFGAGNDVRLVRDAAATLALRNGANAQTFNFYQSWTDVSNYIGGYLAAASGIVTLGGRTAGTGADDVDIAITPAGAGLVRLGTHAGLAGETVTGYITVKDAGGTTRKLAVVS